MKTLTLTQPWATLVILGIKQWETRGWFTRERGRIGIHAAKGWTRLDREFVDDLIELGILPVGTPLPLGAVLGSVRLDGLVRTDLAVRQGYISPTEQMLGDYSPGRYAWELGDPRPLPEPLPWKGALGLWDGPDGVA